MYSELSQREAVDRSGRIVDDDVDLVVRVGLQIRLDHHAVPAV